MAPSQSPRVRLFHIRDEIDGVAAIVSDLSFKQFQASYLHRRAVERAAQIVSEAAKALPADLLARYADAPWKSIIGIGNVLRHEYQRLDEGLLWEIATVHLPALKHIIRRMIEELED
jgi:uncharacterized protein with HEPN domain